MGISVGFSRSERSSQFQLEQQIKLLTFAILVSFFVQQSNGYGNGAPEYDEICTVMAPHHAFISPAPMPQTTAPPYEVTLNKYVAIGGEKLKITLVPKVGNSGQEFKGFMLRSQNIASPNERTHLGTFISNSQDVKVMNCFQEKSSGATHSASKEKSKIVVEWLVPNLHAKFVIRATAVENASTFWVDIKSKPITITKTDHTEHTNKNEATTEKIKMPESGGVGVGEVYEGCGKTKGCFGVPTNCMNSQTCNIVTSYNLDDKNNTIFEVSGRAAGYVSVGLSTDMNMGDDLVFGCRRDNETIKIGHYYNPGKYNKFVGDTISQEKQMEPIKTSYQDGVLSCKFMFKGRVARTPSASFDLVDGKYHIMVSQASYANDAKLGRHDTANDRGVSEDNVKLSAKSILGGKDETKLKVHGALMIVAWIFCAPLGMLVARFYRQTFDGVRILGLPLWLLVHMTLFGLALTLTLIAFILIFVDVRGYVENPSNYFSENVHPILGIIGTILAVMQVIGGILRPNPLSKYRVIFGWSHWLLGTVAFVLAIINIFLANTLVRTNLNGYIGFYGVLGGFTAFHLIIHLTLAIVTLIMDRQMGVEDPTRPFMPGPIKRSGQPGEAPGSIIRGILFILEAIVALAAAIALIVFIDQAIK